MFISLCQVLNTIQACINAVYVYYYLLRTASDQTHYDRLTLRSFKWLSIATISDEMQYFFFPCAIANRVKKSQTAKEKKSVEFNWNDNVACLMLCKKNNCVSSLQRIIMIILCSLFIHLFSPSNLFASSSHQFFDFNSLVDGSDFLFTPISVLHCWIKIHSR